MIIRISNASGRPLGPWNNGTYNSVIRDVNKPHYVWVPYVNIRYSRYYKGRWMLRIKPKNQFCYCPNILRTPIGV